MKSLFYTKKSGVFLQLFSLKLTFNANKVGFKLASFIKVGFRV